MKIYLLLLLFIPFVFSCSKEDSDEPDTLNLQIGDMYAGGIVFQTGNGEGGMIAMNVDSGAMRYWEAMELESNGWFVPSISQLETMYFSIGQGADNIGNFADGPYWSSIEGYVLNFANGNSSSGWNPVLNFRVRLISYF
jgi:hypothetical protein